MKINRKQLETKSEDQEEIMQLKEFSKVLIVEEVKLSFLDSEVKEREVAANAKFKTCLEKEEKENWCFFF